MKPLDKMEIIARMEKSAILQILDQVFRDREFFKNQAKVLETVSKGILLSLLTHGQKIDVQFHIDWIEKMLKLSEVGVVDRTVPQGTSQSII